MDTLPGEIMTLIACSTLEGRLCAPDFYSGLECLARLSAVSKRWFNVANPLLYSRAVLEDVTYLARRRVLDEIPSRAFRLLPITPWSYPSQEYTIPHESHLMAAASSGNIRLLQRLATAIPRTLPNTNPALLVSASYMVPWRCVHDRHRLDEDEYGVAEATLLHAAAAGGHDVVVEWLLVQEGVAVDGDSNLCCLCPARVEIGCCDATPLMLALANGKESTARALMMRGATWDRSFPDTEGISALHIMAAQAMYELVEWLEEASRHAQLRPIIARNGPLHDWPDEKGYWSLHYAGRCHSARGDGARRLVTALLRLGAVHRTRDVVQWRRSLAMEAGRLGLNPGGPDSCFANDDAATRTWCERFIWWTAAGNLHGGSLAPEPAEFARSQGSWDIARVIEKTAGQQGVGSLYQGHPGHHQRIRLDGNPEPETGFSQHNVNM